MTEPLFAGPLYGLRFWGVVVDDRGEWLAAPHQRTVWPPGGEWLRATCPTGHAAPTAGCDCGVHAWHPRRSSARGVLAPRSTVAGIIEAQGPAEVHEDGFRAERARPYALVVTPRANAKLIGRLAACYDAQIAEVRGPVELLAWCRERELGLDEDVVARLLGDGDAAALRRARRRRHRGAALRIALALVLAALLVVTGLKVIDDPRDHPLYGRSGEVHRP